MKAIHYCSGIMLCAFLAIHILNHLVILRSEQAHLDFMKKARKIYRRPVVELLIGLAVLTQILSGLILLPAKWNEPGVFARLQTISGAYLSLFLVIHTTAVALGRYRLKKDTNLYYGASVMNFKPQKYVFIPYYTLGLLSFFTHIACVHRKKMTSYVSHASADLQGWIILFTGVIITAAIIIKMSGLKKYRKALTIISNENQLAR